MNKSMLILALLSTLGLSACDRPTVINTPAAPAAVPVPVPVPGPAGPQGEPGKSGESTTIIVTPPASAPAN